MNELKPYNSKAVISNIELVLKTEDITKLNKPTYNFINLMSGFIAHYDLYGFQNYYSDVSKLSEELLDSVNSYTPEYDYEVTNYGEAYAKSQQEIYQAIPGLVKKYGNGLQDSFFTRAKQALQKVHDLSNVALERDDRDLILALVKELELAY